MGRFIRTRMGWASLLCLGLSGTAATAATLSDIWQAVSQHSPEAASALFAKEAGQQRLEQAQALWRPSVNLNAGAGKMSSATDLSGAHFVAPGFGTANGVDFNTSVKQGNASNWDLEVQQPLLDARLSAQSAQLKTSATVADLQYALAKNTLLLGTTQLYFQWLLENQQLSLLNKQLAVVMSLDAQAKERFRLGDAPVTDMLEAQAQQKGLLAQKSLLRNQLKITQKILEDATGWTSAQWEQMGKEVSHLELAKPLDLNAYQNQASSQNLGLRLLAAKLEMAQQNSKTHSLAYSPSMAIVARATHQRLEGNGDFGNSDSNNKQQYLGLQLSIPLYSGGMRSAQLAESLSQVEQLRMDLDAARLLVDENVQAQWLNWESLPEDLNAATALMQAHKKRLDATLLAYQVGDRSLLDVLHAQADFANAELNEFKLKLAFLQGQLSLYGLIGPIEDSQLQVLDAQFSMEQATHPH